MSDSNETVVVDRGGSSGNGGWAVAVIILVIVIAGIFLWMQYGGAPAQEETGGLDINVTLPEGSGEEGGAAQ